MASVRCLRVLSCVPFGKRSCIYGLIVTDINNNNEADVFHRTNLNGERNMYFCKGLGQAIQYTSIEVAENKCRIIDRLLHCLV